MSTLSDLQKKLQQESEGIMFPFSTAVKKQTTQPVLDTTTDSIMSKTKEVAVQPIDPSEVYKGPAVIRYGAEGQRNLVEPDSGMLAGSPFKFSVDPVTGMEKPLPKPGEGIVEDVTPTPPITTPVEPEQPAIDPCPPGYQLVDGVCQPIPQTRSDRDSDETKLPTVEYSELQQQASNLGLNFKLGDSDLFGSNAQPFFDVKSFFQTPNAIASSVLGFFNPLAGAISGAYLRNEYNKSLETLLDRGLIEEVSDGKYRTTPNYSRAIAQSAVGTQEVITKDSALGKEIESSTGIKSGYDDGRRVRDTELEKKAKQVGFTRDEIESGRALAELRDRDRVAPENDKDDNRAVKAYREAQSKKYTQKEKDAFMDKVNALKGASAEDRIKAGKNLPKQNKDSGGGGSNKSGGKIVCTMMNESYGFGSFRNKIWLAYGSKLSKEYEVGYHALFLPLVKYAKQKGFTNNIVKNILEHIARHRTVDIRKQKYNKVDVLGRTYRTILEPLCYITGRIKLWKKK
jgi:hypothetical protein